MKRSLLLILIAAIGLSTRAAARGAAGRASELTSKRYVASARSFADTVLKHARDVYGQTKTPLFVDGLHAETLEPVKWKGKGGEAWILCNFASQQPLLRLLDGLTALTGHEPYRRAAEQATRHALANLRAPNGLLYWGGHAAWDLQQDRAVGQGRPFVHELKHHQPYYELMWRVNAQAARKLTEAVWAGHVVDWARLDYNRHATTHKPAKPRWDHEFQENIEVPFPAAGKNLSFSNVTPPLMHSGVTLAILGKDDHALTWCRRLVYRWQQARDPKTGLCGGQLSYRKGDRAKSALGHVHPNINEAKIVGSSHQTSRYHRLPLVQMQAGRRLAAAGGRRAEMGREFIRWASEDLKTYARECYDEEKGHFVAKMTDGTVIDGPKSKRGYYVPESFVPRKGGGWLLWAYATAYRLTRDAAHWKMLRSLGRRLALGDLGEAGGEHKLRFDTNCRDWRIVYALLEIHEATKDPAVLRLAARVGDNLVATQSRTGLFARPGRAHARTGDEIPLALLHLAASIEGKRAALPQAICDSRFFHCVYYGKLEAHQKKRADSRTYDNRVFYGGD